MEEVLIVVGAAYLVLTGVGAAIPRTRVGKWARRVAGDIRGEAKKHVDAFDQAQSVPKKKRRG